MTEGLKLKITGLYFLKRGQNDSQKRKALRIVCFVLNCHSTGRDNLPLAIADKDSIKVHFIKVPHLGILKTHRCPSPTHLSISDPFRGHSGVASEESFWQDYRLSP